MAIFYMKGVLVPWRGKTVPDSLRLGNGLDSVNGYVERALSLKQSALFGGQGHGIPEWALDEIQFVRANIDPNIYRDGWGFTVPHEYKITIRPKLGQAFNRVMHELRKRDIFPNPTHCYVMPFVGTGGSDLEALNIINFTASMPGTRCVLLITDGHGNEWLARVNDKVKIAILTDVMHELDEGDMEILLLRVVEQLKPSILHIINSHVAWRMHGRFGGILGSITNVYINIFCDDFDITGAPVGYVRRFINDVYDNTCRFICDNHAYVKEIASFYGLDRSKFSTVYHPVNSGDIDSALEKQNAERFDSGEGVSVLWASRLDRQKRPELLIEIAEILNEYEFHVFGDFVLDLTENNELMEKLLKVKNITFFGKYSQFSELVGDTDYQAFLYTSAWDGLPNVLLEAVVGNIPVVAPDVGGISELINDDTGFLVRESDSASAFARALRNAVENRELASSRVRAANELVQKRHSWKRFGEELANCGYLVSEDRRS